MFYFNVSMKIIEEVYHSNKLFHFYINLMEQFNEVAFTFKGTIACMSVIPQNLSLQLIETLRFLLFVERPVQFSK